MLVNLHRGEACVVTQAVLAAVSGHSVAVQLCSDAAGGTCIKLESK